MTHDMHTIVAQIDHDIRAAGHPGRATAQQRYLKSDLEFVGAAVPAVRAAVKTVRAIYPQLDHDAMARLVQLLWDTPIFERRLAAVEVLVSFAPLLEPSDLRLSERLLREAKTWALVDGLAISVVAPLVQRHPDLAATLDAWATDPDFWVRRAALLALLPSLRAGGGEFERFCAYAEAMLDEREFFIRKAIGWILREISKQRPALVYNWLLPRIHRASGVTMREAVKYLP